MGPRLLALLALLAACGDDDAGADAGAPDAAAVVELRLGPAGRHTLAVHEPLPLSVVAIDSTGAEREVTGLASFAVRDPLAGEVSGGSFVAGAVGSRSTTVIASHAGVSSDPVLVTVLRPRFLEDFDAPRAVVVSGSGFLLGYGQRYAPDPVLDGAGSFTINLDGVAGDRVRITLPLAQPLSLTVAERALFAYRLTGDVGLRVAFGSENGPTPVDALDTAALEVAAGESAHASLPLASAAFDESWDARAVSLDVTLTSDGAGTLLLDNVRVLSQFVLGANLAWLDGAYAHDFGRSFHDPAWSVAYDPAHVEEILGFADAAGIRLLRVWVFDGCEGLEKDAAGLVTGLDPTLLESFDDLVFTQAPRHDVKLYLTLLVAAHVATCPDPSPLADAAAGAALLDNAVVPFVDRYASSPWVWGIDLINEPEAAVAGDTGNWTATGVDWTAMRAFLTDAAARVRAAGPLLYISAGSGWHQEENIRAGLLSGLGFNHLDWHAYNDTGALPAYSSLLRHARVLIGEAGQMDTAFDDALQDLVLAGMLAGAGDHWGVLAWDIDYPGSTNRHTLLDPASTYGDLRPRPAAETLRAFFASREDIGP